MHEAKEARDKLVKHAKDLKKKTQEIHAQLTKKVCKYGSLANAVLEVLREAHAGSPRNFLLNTVLEDIGRGPRRLHT